MALLTLSLTISCPSCCVYRLQKSEAYIVESVYGKFEQDCKLIIKLKCGKQSAHTYSILNSMSIYVSPTKELTLKTANCDEIISSAENNKIYFEKQIIQFVPSTE